MTIDSLRNLFASGRAKRKREHFIPRIHAEKNDAGEAQIDLALRVWIYRESGRWVAQGIDIDYVASGSTFPEARQKFTRGLVATICLYLEEAGSIEEFVRPAPASIVHQFNRVTINQKKIDPKIRRVTKRLDGGTMRGSLAYIAPQHVHA